MVRCGRPLEIQRCKSESHPINGYQDNGIKPSPPFIDFSVLESSGENEKHETGVDCFIYPARSRVGRATKWANQQSALFFPRGAKLIEKGLLHFSSYLDHPFVKNNVRESFVDESTLFKMV